MNVTLITEDFEMNFESDQKRSETSHTVLWDRGSRHFRILVEKPATEDVATAVNWSRGLRSTEKKRTAKSKKRKRKHATLKRTKQLKKQLQNLAANDILTRDDKANVTVDPPCMTDPCPPRTTPCPPRIPQCR